MADEIDVQILEKTLKYLNENCVGPQRAYFVYKALCKEFEAITSFSYSYFISLFNNNEIINKNLVNQQLENIKKHNLGESGSKKVELDQYNTKTIINVEQEEKHRTIIKKRQTEALKDISDDMFYYCTKCNRVLKADVLKTLLELFKQNNSDYEDIKDCYAYLQQAFNVSSFNMSNLKELLQTDKIVAKLKVNELYLSLPLSMTKPKIIDLKTMLVNNRNVIKSVIENLGLEYVVDLVNRGLNSTISFMKALEDFDNSFVCKLELADPNNDRVFNKTDEKLFLGFLTMFKEEELLTILSSEDSISELVDMYLEDERVKVEIEKFSTDLHELSLNIHQDNLKAKCKYILPFEIVPFCSQNQIATIKDFQETNPNKLRDLFQHKSLIGNFIKVLQQSLPLYLNEKFKLLLQRVNTSNVPNSQWEKYVETMLYREQGLNLEETSKYFDTSRERIRQIENRYIAMFNEFYNSQNGTLTRLIRGFAKNEWYLTKDDINSIFSFYPQLFTYLLKKIEIEDLVYIEELDVFYFVDELDWYKELLIVYDRLEDMVSVDKMQETIKKTYEKLKSDGVDIPFEFCETVILQDFKQNGTVYSKTRISLLTKYRKVLEKAFPNGIKVYDEQDIALFRKTYNELFSDNKLPDNDRALYGRITANCFLVGKGVYKLKQEHYISDELANKIYQYIMDSPREIFLTNTLYAAFEDELNAEGVTNKYYLQGVMKELFGDKLYFSRDYISKSNDKSSIYSEIYEFVRQAGREVKLEEITQEFKNVPINVINTGLANENILKCSGSYIHTDHIKMTEQDVKHLRQIIEDVLNNCEIGNTYTLFDELKTKKDYIIYKFQIETQFKLFSILQYYLQDEFEFQRPYFARKGYKIGYQKERIINYVKENGEVSLDDIRNEFTTVGDSVIYNALASEEILSYRKTYCHTDNFNIDQQEKNELLDVIKNLCSDNKSHSSYELMLILDLKHQTLINKYNIDEQFKLFSIIKYLFKDEFEFQRPYFATKGVEIVSRYDRIVDYLRQYDEIQINDLWDYVYSNQLGLASITEFINEMSDEYVFKDKNTIIDIEKTNINKYNVQIAENVLCNAMKNDEFIISSKFTNYDFLPNNVKWTDWLLFSAINKYGTKLKAITSSAQMRHSEPVFIKRELPINNIDQLKNYLKNKYHYDDVTFVKYLNTKGLLD